MAREGRALVEIFDVSGRLVKTVFDGIAKEGVNAVHWNGTERPSGGQRRVLLSPRRRTEYAKKLVIVRN